MELTIIFIVSIVGFYFLTIFLDNWSMHDSSRGGKATFFLMAFVLLSVLIVLGYAGIIWKLVYEPNPHKIFNQYIYRRYPAGTPTHPKYWNN